MYNKKARKQVKAAHRAGRAIAAALLGCLLAGNAIAGAEQGIVVASEPQLSQAHQIPGDHSLDAGRAAVSHVPGPGAIRKTELVVTRDSSQSVAIPAHGGVGLSVPGNEPGYRVYAVSAAVNPGDYVLPGGRVYNASAAEDSAGGVDIAKSPEDQPLSYALMLALVALIVLVPVSRRKH